MRDVLDRALAEILRGAPTAETVAATLRAGGFDRVGRRRVARTLFRASIFRLRLAFLADVDATADGAAALIDALDAGLDVGPGPDDPRWPRDPLERLVVERSCPRPLVALLVDALGHAGANAFLAASNEPGPKTLRANTLKTDRDALAASLAAEGIATRPGTHTPWALHVVEGESGATANITGSAAWRAGLFEVQDEASQLCVLACAARREEVAVDLCAGRGGKTLGLAAAMEDDGALHWDDVDGRALADVPARLARAGVRCARRGLPDDGTADVVLVDAPCSSLGPLRRWPDLRFTFDPASLDVLSVTQRALLARGARLVRPGGRLVFATCSVLPREGVGIASAFLEEPAGRDFHLEHARALRPDVEGTDGFTIALLRRAPAR